MVVATSELNERLVFGLKHTSIPADRSLLVMSQHGAGASDGGSDKFGGISMDSLITAATRMGEDGLEPGSVRSIARGREAADHGSTTADIR